MRPHRLRVTAFGPFAGAVEVDLDALSAAGVFLLQGETGAGKTTLLDALGFALYGRVPGERAKAKRLRSDHADPAVRTAVELEVTLAGRRLRIGRSPQQDKASARGGTTSVPTKVSLDELVGGSWQSVSTRVGEADAEIAALMGMSAEQFFQVVLLPQGEFATFLRADAARRGELLARLFGTDRYRAVEDHLAQLRRDTAAVLDEAEQDARVLAARLTQAAGVDATAPIVAGEPTEVDDVVDRAFVASVTAQVQARAARSATRVGTAQEEAARARGAAHEADRLAAAQQRRAALDARQTALAAQQEEHARRTRECSAAERAAVVQPWLTELASRRAVAEQAQQRWLTARTALGRVDQDLPLLLSTERSRVARLEGLRHVADALADEQQQQSTAEHEQQAAAAALVLALESERQIPLQLAQAGTALEAARQAAVALPQRQAALDLRRSQTTDAAVLAGSRMAVALARDELVLARDSALSLREKALEIREARFESMVAELAFGLEDDAPCPVCGAVDHPDPSLLTGARVTRDDEDRAQDEHAAAQQRVEDLTVRLAAVQATVDSLVARLGPAAELTAEQLSASAAELVDEVDALLVTSGQVGELDAALAALAARLAAAGQERTAAAVAEAAAARRAMESRDRSRGLHRQLAAVLNGAPDLVQALQDAASTVQAIEVVLELQEVADVAAHEGRAAETAAQRAAADGGFTGAQGIDDAEQAWRPVDWLVQARAQLAAYDAEHAAVAALLADPDLNVPLTPAAPVEPTQAALSAAVAEHEEALAAAATADEAARAVGGLGPHVLAALDDLAPLQARAEEVRHLADLAAGTSVSNTLRMSLSSYVLAARLEEVALAASERLLRMTQGRFSLVHTDTARGGGRAGLGLLARDAWTGQDRETATLSGGETFLASLALALGLADVVAAESGGARIEALFVDEGFGTLDEETLDEVMDVLDSLREGGRVVGVVSHVAELRHRIPSQVQVRKGRTGSDLTLVGC